jgi:hypothetical protein
MASGDGMLRSVRRIIVAAFVLPNKGWGTLMKRGANMQGGGRVCWVTFLQKEPSGHIHLPVSEG